MKTYGTKGGKYTIAALSQGWTKAHAKVARARARRDATKMIARALKGV